MQEIVAKNYTGPTTLNDAFSAVPHVILEWPPHLFTATPENVSDDYDRYGLSLILVPALLGLVVAFISIGVFTATCCRGCACCAPDKLCKACACCSKKDGCCRALAIRAPFGKDPASVASLVLTVFALAGFACAIAMYIATSNSTQTITRKIDDLEDYRISIRDQTLALRDLAVSNDQDLAVLVNETTTINITAPLRAQLVVAQASSQQSIQDTNDALSVVDTDLNVKKYTRDARNYIGLVALSMSMLVVIFIVCGAMSLVATHTCKKPSVQGQYAAENTAAAVSLLPTAIILVVIFAILVSIGDFCKSPTGYLNKMVGESSSMLSYYINCIPGSSNPEGGSLRSAYMSAATAQSIVYDLYLETNGTYANVSADALALDGQYEVFLIGINITAAMSDCVKPHSMLVDIENQICRPGFEFGVAAFLLTACALALLVASECALPRRLSRELLRQQKQDDEASVKLKDSSPPPPET